MRIIKPGEVKNVLLYRHRYIRMAIISAYNSLICDNFKWKNTTQHSTIKQSSLVQKIHQLGLPISHANLVGERLLDVEEELEDAGWKVKTRDGFYDLIDPEAVITIVPFNLKEVMDISGMLSTAGKTTEDTL